MSFQAKLYEYLKQIESNLLTVHNLSYMHDCEELQNEQEKLDLQEEICNMRDKTANVTAALCAAQQADLESLADIKKTYQNALSKADSKKKNYKLTKEYKEFKSQMNNIATNAEAAKNTTSNEATRNCVVTDEFVMESEINVFDPLTKKRMAYPVRNTVCGHHYEKSSMYEALRLNPHIRCPVAGCGNKQPVKMNNLVDDAEFRASLEQALLECEYEE